MRRKHNPKELSEVQTLKKQYSQKIHLYEFNKLENELELELAKEGLTKEIQLGLCSECNRHGIKITELLGRQLKRCEICGHNFGAINK